MQVLILNGDFGVFRREINAYLQDGSVLIPDSMKVSENGVWAAVVETDPDRYRKTYLTPVKVSGLM